MILRSIMVSGWRCFAGPAAVGPFQEGINVLWAPNASGKSTIFEAMVRAVFDGHRTGGRDVEAIRPWGRDLAPAVAMEFASGGIEYRISKRFLDKPYARLERREDGRFVPLAEGDAADERVRDIIMGSAPGRGLSRPEHWGLAQVLWATQGDLKLAGVSSNVQEDIRESLGAQISGPESQAVEEAIRKAYLEVFTSTGRYKSGGGAPRVVTLRASLDAARRKRDEALAKQELFEKAAQRVVEVRSAREQAQREFDRLGRELGAARERAQGYRDLLGEKAQREYRAKAAQAGYSELKSRIDSIASARKDIQDASGAMEKLVAELPALMENVEIKEKEAADAEAGLKEVRAGRKSVDAAQEEAEQARLFVENNRALSELDSRLHRIAVASKELETLTGQRRALAAPDANALRTIQKAAGDLERAQTGIEGALLNLEIVPEGAGQVEVVKAETAGTVDLVPGEPVHVKGSPEILVNVPGFGRMRVWGPVGSLEQFRKMKAEVERQIKKLTAPYGTENIEELESLASQAAEMDAKMRDLQVQIEAQLSGQRLEVLQRDRQKVEGVLAVLKESHPAWVTNPPDVAAWQAKAKQVKDAFLVAVDAAEKRWKEAQPVAAEAKSRRAEIAARIEEKKSRLQDAEMKLVMLTSDGKPDAEREAELTRLAMQWNAADAGQKDVENRLAAFRDDPVVVVERLEQEHSAADTMARNLELDERAELQGLHHYGDEGPYSVLAAAEEDVARLEKELATEDLRATALKLLHDTVGECREQLLTGVAGPVEARATELLKRIAGPGMGSLRLDDFTPARVVPGGVGMFGEDDTVVPVDGGLWGFSGGEREQIYLAVRLALAEVLARGERQLVVLDDVLNHTDPERLSRIRGILEEASEHLQILILTCHPDRYRQLSGAGLVGLGSLEAD